MKRLMLVFYLATGLPTLHAAHSDFDRDANQSSDEGSSISNDISHDSEESFFDALANSGPFISIFSNDASELTGDLDTDLHTILNAKLDEINELTINLDNALKLKFLIEESKNLSSILAKNTTNQAEKDRLYNISDHLDDILNKIKFVENKQPIREKTLSEKINFHLYQASEAFNNDDKDKQKYHLKKYDEYNLQLEDKRTENEQRIAKLQKEAAEEKNANLSNEEYHE